MGRSKIDCLVSIGKSTISTMIFTSTSKHYVRYQLAAQASLNPSTPGDFYAWSDTKAPPRVMEGDFVWLLARIGTSSPGVFRFAYVFKAESSAIKDKGRWKLHGTDGLMLPEDAWVGQKQWFPAFYKHMGRGGISIQEIPAHFLPAVVSVVPLMTAPTDDPLDNRADLADSEGRADDDIALRAIKTRRGQHRFRQDLLLAYERRCCVSGCGVEDLLEAAHIRSHSEETNCSLNNGLLLRSDLHTLFDLNLLGIDSTGRIRISKVILDTNYRDLEKVGRIRPPRSAKDKPSEFALDTRMARFNAG
jgi:hypothetical protein